ncbi:hypothetical protein FJZ26_05990, partial [Candidatus Parvarchaeota archaeon]|nr:hypothetical protein [Candidatus Parvarchaeota archaeon]
MGNFDLKEAAISISKQLGEPEWLLEFRLKCLQSYQAATFDKGIQAAANMLEEAAGTMKETWHGKGSVRLGGDAEFESLHSLAADSEFEQKARKAVEMAAGKFEKLDFLAGALFTSWIVARARKKSGRAKVWLGFGKPGRFGVVQLEVPKECTVGLEIENDSSGFAKGASGGCLQCTV